MDFATLRAALPGMTRAVFGDKVTITPMLKGRTRIEVDPSRPVMTEVDGRFDFNSEDIAVGGGEGRGKAHLAAESATVSFDIAALSWLPQIGDHVSRIHGGLTETYEIVRPGRDGSNVRLYFLSRVS